MVTFKSLLVSLAIISIKIIPKTQLWKAGKISVKYHSWSNGTKLQLDFNQIVWTSITLFTQEPAQGILIVSILLTIEQLLCNLVYLLYNQEPNQMSARLNRFHVEAGIISVFFFFIIIIHCTLIPFARFPVKAFKVPQWVAEKHFYDYSVWNQVRRQNVHDFDLSTRRIASITSQFAIWT